MRSSIFLRASSERSLVHVFLIEAFALILVPSIKSVVEICVQYGMSTRRIIYIKNDLGLNLPIYAFDIVDEVKFFSLDEAVLRLEDLTDRFETSVLGKYPPGLIYLDAHPYKLLKEIISEVLKDGRFILVIHDCGRGLYNRYMPITRKENHLITSLTGMWERHVLAELLGIKNPADLQINDTTTTNYRLRIFSTKHGLTVLLPK